MLKPTEPKFYVDLDGRYLGSLSGIQKLVGTYEDGSEAVLHPGEFPFIPLGAREVSSAPSDARQLWDFNKKVWLPVEENIEN